MWLLFCSVLGLIYPVFTFPSVKDYKPYSQPPTVRFTEQDSVETEDYELFNQRPTVRLTAQSFREKVKFSPNPWLIVIYDKSSESCQRYSKYVWPRLAKLGEHEVWERFPIFGKNRVGAIEKNEGLFTTDEQAFPIIKIFPPRSNGVPLSRKINPYNITEMLNILTTIQAVSHLKVLPKTSQGWTTLIDKILTLPDGKEETFLVETYTKITYTTTRVETPNSILRSFLALIFLLLLCCKCIVKCSNGCAPENKELEVPVRSFHGDPAYTYAHPQSRARSEAIPLPPP